MNLPSGLSGELKERMASLVTNGDPPVRQNTSDMYSGDRSTASQPGACWHSSIDLVKFTSSSPGTSTSSTAIDLSLNTLFTAQNASLRLVVNIRNDAEQLLSHASASPRDCVSINP